MEIKVFRIVALVGLCWFVRAFVKLHIILPIRRLFHDVGIIGEDELAIVIQNSTDDDLEKILTRRSSLFKRKGRDERPRDNSTELTIEYIAILFKKKNLLDMLRNENYPIYQRAELAQQYMNDMSNVSCMAPNLAHGDLFAEWEPFAEHSEIPVVVVDVNIDDQQI